MKKQKQTKSILNREWLIESLLIIILIVLTGFMIVSVANIQGTARVVNYTGIVRGATQRLVKLEMTGHQNDELIVYLNEILDGLEKGGGTYDLIMPDSDDYRDKLQAVLDYWEDLQHEIFVARENGPEQSELLQMSEIYFYLADDLVGSVENFSQENATLIRRLEAGIICDIILILLLLIKQSVNAVKLNLKNGELNKTAYIDLPTGLPNKSKCELVLSEQTNITVPTCCMMFDLNCLKKVNDSLGHMVGDILIHNFSGILRRIIPERYFLGRYGGDEFIAVITDMSKAEIESLIEKIEEETLRFNKDSGQAPISFACGYAISSDYRECTLQMLLSKADYNMYLNKQKVKTDVNMT